MGFFDQVILDARPRARRDASLDVDAADDSNGLVWPTTVAPRRGEYPRADATPRTQDSRIPTPSNAPSERSDQVRVQRQSAGSDTPGRAPASSPESSAMSAVPQSEIMWQREESASADSAFRQEIPAVADSELPLVEVGRRSTASESTPAAQPLPSSGGPAGPMKAAQPETSPNIAGDKGAVIRTTVIHEAPVVVQRADVDSTASSSRKNEAKSADAPIVSASMPAAESFVDDRSPVRARPSSRHSYREHAPTATADTASEVVGADGDQKPVIPESRDSVVEPAIAEEGPSVETDVGADPALEFAITSPAFPSPSATLSVPQGPAAAIVETPAVVIGQVDVIVAAETPQRDQPAPPPAEAPADLSRLYLRRL